jgi:hypothetical protein
MQCNIDGKGKAVRLISGLVVTAIGLVMLVLAAIAVAGGWLWLVGGALVVIGAFQIFEARAGWCALRAMGWKTPI